MVVSAEMLTTPWTPPAVRSPIGLIERHWAWLTPLLLIVATEYKFRRRPIDEALGGQLDVAIALELAVYGLVGVGVLSALVRRPVPWSGGLIVMWGFIGTSAASAVYSPFLMLGLARGVQFVIIGLTVHLVVQRGSAASMVRMLHAFVGLVSASIVVGVAVVWPVPAYLSGRFTWLRVHAVVAGSMLAVTVVFLAGVLLTGAAGRSGYPWPRWLYGGLLAVHLSFLALNQSRGSIGGTMLALAIMAWIVLRRWRKELLVLGAAAGLAAVLAAGPVLLDFLTRGESAESLATFNRRTEIWSLAWEAFLERPFTGAGFAAAKGVFFEATQLGGAHNALVSVVSETGLVGLTWWLILLVVPIRLVAAARRAGAHRTDTTLIAGLMAALLVNSMTTEFLGTGVSFPSILWLLLLAWSTLLVSAQAPKRPSHTSTPW